MPIRHSFFDRVIGWCLQCIIRYRLNVVRHNLRASFMYTDPRDLEEDVKAFYLFLAKILRQILVHPTRALLQKRIHMDSLPQLQHWLDEGKSVIVTFGHVGNWEWTGSFIGMQYPDRVCALYKKIKAGRIHALMQKRRHAHVRYLVDIKKMGDLLRLMKQQSMLVLMIADQNPASAQSMVWTPFLQRSTAFVNGPEQLALRYHLPVVYIHSLPEGTSNYHLRCEILYDGKTPLPAGEITRRYAMALEQNISACRSHWLWSHKRWKRKPGDTTDK